jgi:16S rRNA (guanine(1405)-N(7))-methyltransferase
MPDPDLITAVVSAIKESKKYRDTSEDTIRALAVEALQQYKKVKPAVKAVRVRLHSIMAPYLGDPDYAAAATTLTAAYTSQDPALIRQTCWEIMAHHLSTRERLPILTEFYQQIFAITGKPQSILDIACGLNPLALPWMDLPTLTDFYAYDIHEPRIQFLNHFFELNGLRPQAILQDVALNFPQEEGDVALFLKEMPRFERNYHGLGRPLLEALRVRYIVLSFPEVSTHGGRNLVNRYRDFCHQLIAGHDWPITELLFEGELVFCIEKKK